MLDAFRAGVASSSKLLDAEVARAVSKLSLLNAAYQCTLSLARLLEASGLIHTFGDYRDKAILLDI
jgi:outer membrane protein TolC